MPFGVGFFFTYIFLSTNEIILKRRFDVKKL